MFWQKERQIVSNQVKNVNSQLIKTLESFGALSEKWVN
jgi:hypothetical protein